MASKQEISEIFDDFGFCAEDPLIINRLYAISVKYGMDEKQLARKYVEFAQTELSSYQLNLGNLCLFELLLDNKQCLEKGTENESRVYDTKVSVASELDTTIEMTLPSSGKSMVAQCLEKETGNESENSVPSEKESKVIPNPFMGKKFLENDVPIWFENDSEYELSCKWVMKKHRDLFINSTCKSILCSFT